MIFECLVGLRYIRAKRRNGFISFISLISVVGIALGVAALIIVLSVMNGFQKEVRDRILGMTSHVQIMGYDKVLYNWRLIRDRVKTQPSVVAIAPFVEGQGLLTNGELVRGAQVRGIDPAQEVGVNEVVGKLVQGSVDLLKPGGFGIILGWNLANDLGLRLGDRVTLITPQGQVTPAGLIPRLRQFTLLGIFRADYYPYDAGLALIHLQDAQRLFRTGHGISGLRLKLDDLFHARSEARLLQQQWPNALVSDWTRENLPYFQAVEIEKRMMFIILTLIVAVAAFNLVSTLVMMVTDKQADIAILRTLGASPSSIMRIFMLHGALSGLVGTLSGVIIGVLVATNIDVILPAIEHLFDKHFLSPDIYQISRMPSRVVLSDILSISLVSLLLAFAATLYPSWRAARTHPAEALRYE